VNKSPLVMIVDDDDDNRSLIQVLIEDRYRTIGVSSGKNCLATIKKISPDLVLLDVNMPEMNGYEVCTQLRKQFDTRFLPVIFVSAMNRVEERLAGFEAGGDEYVIKPVERGKLLDKIQYCLGNQQETLNARKEAADAMSVAMEAMTSNSELGKIIQFVKTLNESETLLAIAQVTSQVMQEFNLNVCIMVKGSYPIYVDCEPDSLEVKLMQQLQNHTERLISAGIRTVVQCDKIIMLIKNMPVDKENLYGRLKDHLAVLVDMANNRILTILFQITMSQQRKELINDIILLAEKQIKITSDKLLRHDKNVRDTMQSMLSGLENMLFGLGLEDDQEKALVQLADGASEKLAQSNRSTTELDAELGVILESLYDLIAKESNV